MAASERRALGRGLGSLIPDRDPNVSRETISNSRASGRPSDLFFTGGSGRDSGERRSRSLSADLLKPAPRSKRTKSAAASAKAEAKSSKAPSKSGANKSRVEAESETPSTEPRDFESQDSAADVNSGHTEKKNPARKADKRPLFADIIEGDAAGASTSDSSAGVLDAESTHSGVSADAVEQSGHASADVEQGSEDAANVDPAAESEDVQLLPVPGATFAEIAVELIVPNPKQPREIFDEFDLQELAESIREIGVLQPVVVRPVDGSDERFASIVAQRAAEGVTTLPAYELIMGERRLRASKLAGLKEIPAIVRDTEDDALLRDALLENLHRSQLNPIEEANAYQQLMSDFGYTQQELSDRIKRSRPQIANALRLLKLPPSVQRKLAAGVISAGHARALLGLSNARQMEVLCERIIAEGLSVRTTEEIVALGEVSEGVAAKKSVKRMPQPLSENASAVVERLTDLFDTRVTVFEGKRKGRITIEYAGSDDLQRISQLLADLPRQEF